MPCHRLRPGPHPLHPRRRLELQKLQGGERRPASAFREREACVQPPGHAGSSRKGPAAQERAARRTGLLSSRRQDGGKMQNISFCVLGLVGFYFGLLSFNAFKRSPQVPLSARPSSGKQSWLRQPRAHSEMSGALRWGDSVEDDGAGEAEEVLLPETQVRRRNPRRLRDTSGVSRAQAALPAASLSVRGWRLAVQPLGRAVQPPTRARLTPAANLPPPTCRSSAPTSTASRRSSSSR